MPSWTGVEFFRNKARWVGRMLRGLSTPRKNILGKKTKENEKEEREDNFAKSPLFFFLFAKEKKLVNSL
jgi:hypothetical protein